MVEKIEKIIKNNEVASSLLNSLIDITTEKLDLPINPYNEYESEEEKYLYYDQLYGYLLYNVIEHDGITSQLGINGTSDLIEFHELIN